MFSAVNDARTGRLGCKINGKTFVGYYNGACYVCIRREETLITANMEGGLLHRYDQGLFNRCIPACRKEV